EVPPQVRPRDLSAGLFQPSPDDMLVELDGGPGGRWVAEQHPTEFVRDAGDGRLHVGMRVSDPGFVVRLALRLGRDGRVLAPAEAAENVRQRAREALAAYAPAESAARPGRS